MEFDTDIPHIFSSDGPIARSDDDELGRKEFAWRIADVIIKRNQSDSIVIGLDAPWGDGKTSVLNMIVEKLEKHQPDPAKALLGDDVLVFRFNPWRFSDEGQLLTNFYKLLAGKIEAPLKSKTEKLAGFVRKGAEFAKPLDEFEFYGLKFNFSESIKSLGEMKADADLDEIKKRLGAGFEQTKYKVVVVMDDIDRLNKEEMHAIFRLVKLSADIPKVTYILSFDVERVAEALMDKYGSREAGKSFLEKIVQVHLKLPPVSPTRLIDLTIRGIRSALDLAFITFDENQAFIFSDLFRRAFQYKINNPRMSKRLINSLTFAIPLVKDEVNILDFIFIEAMRFFYPDFYEIIKENGDLFAGLTSLDSLYDMVGGKDERKDLLYELLNSQIALSRRETEGFKALLQYLFPLTEMFCKVYDRYGERNSAHKNNKRISTGDYFTRYFTFNIEPDDISDKKIADFLAKIPNAEFDSKSAINDLIKESDQKALVFINKIRSHMQHLPPETQTELALRISAAAEVFPNSHPDDKAFGLGAMVQAVHLVYWLLNNNPEQRNDLSLKIIEQTSSTMFAYDFIEAVKPAESRPDFLPAEVFAEIVQVVVNRIKVEVRNQSLESIYGIFSQDFYLFWYHCDLPGLQKYVRERIDSDLSQVIPIIAGILRINLETDKSYSSFLMRGGDFLAILTQSIGIDRIFHAIKETFGHCEPEGFSDSKPERIAKEFIETYKSRNDQNLRLPEPPAINDLEQFGFA